MPQIRLNLRQYTPNMFYLQMIRHFRYYQKYRLHYFHNILKLFNKIGQSYNKFHCLVIEWIFTGSEYNFNVLGLLINLMYEKWVDNILCDVFLFVSIIHEPRQVTIDFPLIWNFLWYRGIRLHFTANCDLIFWASNFFL